MKDSSSIGIFCVDPNPAGQPIALLLHGLGADSGSWAYQVHALINAGIRPIAPDLPGFGKSRYDFGKWDISNVARIMYEWITSISNSGLVVIGISLGGGIALRMVLDHPEVASRLILINSFACLRPKRLSEVFYLLRRFLLANIKGVNAQAEIVAKRLFPETDQEQYRNEIISKIKGSDPDVYRAAMRELLWFDVRKELFRIRIPSLIMTAQNDTTVPPELQNDLSRRIPRSRQVIIPNARHGVIIDQSDMVNKLLISFILEGV